MDRQDDIKRLPSVKNYFERDIGKIKGKKMIEQYEIYKLGFYAKYGEPIEYKGEKPKAPIPCPNCGVDITDWSNGKKCIGCGKEIKELAA